MDGCTEARSFFKKEPKNFHPLSMVKMDESLFASFSLEKEESFSTMQTDPPSQNVNTRPRNVAPSDQVEIRVVCQSQIIAIATLPRCTHVTSNRIAAQRPPTTLDFLCPNREQCR